MSSLWRQSLESWLKTIEVSGSCLDVGGAQKPVKGRTKTWDVDEYQITDIGAYGRDDVMYWDIEEPFVSDLGIEFVDNVFLLEVLMYCNDPFGALRNICEAMVDKNLYISNPLELYGWTKPHEKDMCRLSGDWWHEQLTFFGLEVVDMKVIWPSEESKRLLEQVRKNEGYKMIRPHASGILIHAQKNG